jgi:hypothetical protein
MLKRTWSFLLVIALFAAPGAAFAAAPDRAVPERGPSLIERMWEGFLRFIDLDGDDFRERIRETEGPRNVSGADEGGGTLDPDG